MKLDYASITEIPETVDAFALTPLQEVSPFKVNNLVYRFKLNKAVYEELLLDEVLLERFKHNINCDIECGLKSNSKVISYSIINKSFDSKEDFFLAQPNVYEYRLLVRIIKRN